MSEAERRARFTEELNRELARLAQAYGFQIGADIQTRHLGRAVLNEAVIVTVPMEGWTEPLRPAPISIVQEPGL